MELLYSTRMFLTIIIHNTQKLTLIEISTLVSPRKLCGNCKYFPVWLVEKGKVLLRIIMYNIKMNMHIFIWTNRDSVRPFNS